MTLRIGLVGARGYAGRELIAILARRARMAISSRPA
jgi:N-acetyl-gamma-glutamylphosphate reductase